MVLYLHTVIIIFWLCLCCMMFSHHVLKQCAQLLQRKPGTLFSPSTTTYAQGTHVPSVCYAKAFWRFMHWCMPLAARISLARLNILLRKRGCPTFAKMMLTRRTWCLNKTAKLQPTPPSYSWNYKAACLNTTKSYNLTFVVSFGMHPPQTPLHFN